MRAHQLDANGVIVNTIVVPALDFMPGLSDASIGGQPGDRIENSAVIAAAPPMPTLPEYVAAVQTMLDAKAQERRYFGMQSASTYAASTNATFKAEAGALLAWRDNVWLTAYAKLDAVTAGTLPQPTIPELLAMLPTMEWPNG